MRKSEVVTRGSVWSSRGALPAVNVKVYKSWDDVTPAEWSSVRAEIADGLSEEWIREHLTEDDIDAYWRAACEDGFEQAELELAEVFDDHRARYELKLWQDGRSGGWLVVEGLPDVESWDAVMLAKWSRFVRYCASIVDDIPRMTAWLIGANVFDRELADFELAESTRDDIMADALSALKVG